MTNMTKGDDIFHDGLFLLVEMEDEVVGWMDEDKDEEKWRTGKGGGADSSGLSNHCPNHVSGINPEL